MHKNVFLLFVCLFVCLVLTCKVLLQFSDDCCFTHVTLADDFNKSFFSLICMVMQPVRLAVIPRAALSGVLFVSTLCTATIFFCF